MTLPRRFIVPALLLCILCLSTPRTTRADKLKIVGNGEIAGAIAGIAGAGALIGFGIYYAVHHGRSLTGCASSHPGGMQLLNEGDQKIYLLDGDITGITPGDRVRVSGNKRKSGNAQMFFVKKLSKDDGPCKTPASTQ